MVGYARYFLEDLMAEETSFQYFNEALLNMGAISSASELQGFICGKLAGGKAAPEELPDEWMYEIQRFMDMEFFKLSDQQAALVVELYTETTVSLGDDDFTFRPMLPEDEATLQRRTEELAAWCRGFLHGLGTSGLQASDKISAVVADALRDLAKISQAEMDEAVVEDELETDFENLVEYVKVAVLTINHEVGEPTQSVH